MTPPPTRLALLLLLGAASAQADNRLEEITMQVIQLNREDASGYVNRIELPAALRQGEPNRSRERNRTQTRNGTETSQIADEREELQRERREPLDRELREQHEEVVELEGAQALDEQEDRDTDTDSDKGNDRPRDGDDEPHERQSGEDAKSPVEHLDPSAD